MKSRNKNKSTDVNSHSHNDERRHNDGHKHGQSAGDSHGHSIDVKLFADLVRELSEFNRNVKNGFVHLHGTGIGHLAYAFDPSAKHDGDRYGKHIRITDAIHEVLGECRINIKSKGYSYIRDAICLISDYNSMDICLNKEIYPHIAKKHRVASISRIEHSIRNAIHAAYKARHKHGHDQHSIMHYFKEKPSNKVFLLHAVQEVNGRAWNDICI